MTTLVANTFGWLGFRGMANWFANITVYLQARKAARNTVTELSKLTDYELNDIGMSRGEIRHVAKKHYNDILNENLKGWV
tara:strand:- start:3219 stop:3458 length:240 start_codon:yes stop_codon:yes gene_type:complete